MMKKYWIGLPLLLASIAGAGAQNVYECPAGNCGLSAVRLARIDTLVTQAIADGEIPGAVVCVQRENRIVYLKAFGYRQLVPKKVKMTVNTLFDLASLSKCVGTTTAMMQLIEQGRVRLSDPVTRYFPDFKPWKDPETGEETGITVQDLMTHSSGVDAYVNVAAFVREFGENRPEELMDYIATRTGRHFRPGTDFLYSCLNFITLQHIIEQVSGERLCDYVRENVFEPLGMKQTCYFPLDRKADPELAARCAPTEVQADGLPLVAKVHDPLARIVNNGNSGNAGIFSTAGDLALFAAALMDDGGGFPAKAEPLLGPCTIRTMCSLPASNAPQVGRALGWDKCSSHSGIAGDLFDKRGLICHTGYTGTSMLIDFRTKVAVTVLTNRVHPQDKGSVGRLRAMIANVAAGSILDPVPGNRRLRKCIDDVGNRLQSLR